MRLMASVISVLSSRKGIGDDPFKYCAHSTIARIFFDVSLGTVLKKSHNIRQMVLSIVTLLSCYTNLFYSILSSIDFNT